MDNLLALDSALNRCGAAVYKHDKVYCEILDISRGQAEHLIPLCERLMKRMSMAYDQLDAVLVTIGPGAFTGMRIGLATANSIGMALDIPVYGITTLQSIAYDYKKNESPKEGYTVILETKRIDFYGQDFDCSGRPVCEPYSKTNEQIEKKDKTFIGNGLERFIGECHDSYNSPDPAMMIDAFMNDPNLFTKKPSPLYLRAPDVSMPKSKGRRLEVSRGRPH